MEFSCQWMMILFTKIDYLAPVKKKSDISENMSHHIKYKSHNKIQQIITCYS